jgi:hypothetical protein
VVIERKEVKRIEVEITIKCGFDSVLLRSATIIIFLSPNQ